MGILLEPAEHPYCTPWHRDWRDNVSGLDLNSWNEHMLDDQYFNQVNCPSTQIPARGSFPDLTSATTCRAR